MIWERTKEFVIFKCFLSSDIFISLDNSHWSSFSYVFLFGSRNKINGFSTLYSKYMSTYICKLKFLLQHNNSWTETYVHVVMEFWSTSELALNSIIHLFFVESKYSVSKYMFMCVLSTIWVTLENYLLRYVSRYATSNWSLENAVGKDKENQKIWEKNFTISVLSAGFL